MWRTSLLLALILPWAQAAEPALLPGEGLAMAAEGRIGAYGEAGRSAPMGSLAKLVWMQREGRAWEARGVSFCCGGHWRTWSCWNRTGHGAVDLGGALRDSCNLAFLAWASESLEERARVLGESAARAGLEADFEPFLEGRLTPSAALPALSPAWVGDGALLRTTPEAFLRWLRDSRRDALRSQCARLLPDRAGWWAKTGTAAVPGFPGETCAWVAGGNGSRLAVLRLPRGRGKAEGLARFRALVEEAQP